MRTLIVIVLVLALLAGGTVIYLIATTPREAELLRFPLAPEHRDLLSRVPSSADSFALVPSAAILHRNLNENPVTRDAVARWAFEHELPRPWMLGAAEVVVWKRGGTTSYAIRLDPFRAFVLRAWLVVTSHADTRWDGSTLIMNGGDERGPPGDLDEVLALAEGLPEADALIVQREGERGAFPPIGRPAVTSARITRSELTTVSRAANDDGGEPATVQGRFPSDAMLAVTFSDPPRVLSDLSRIIGTRLDALIGDGGSVVLYEVDFGTLLPRPKGVIAVPSDESRREAMREISPVADLIGETGETGSELTLAFGRGIAERYRAATFVPSRWSANRWSMRIDPERLAPTLRSAGDSRGLRIAAPRIHRGARDLRRWLSVIEQAESVEAASTVSGGIEELVVHVEAK